MRRVWLISILFAFALLISVPWGFCGDSEKVGQDAPAFVAASIFQGEDNGDIDLSALIGKKVILLDFWSIYCVACVQEMPHLADIQNKYGDDMVTLGIDLDSFGAKRVKKFLKKKFPDLPYPVIIDKRRKVAGLYSVSVLPTTIIIDKAGKIIYYHVGYKPGDEKVIDETVGKAIAQ